MFEQTFVDGTGKTHKSWTVVLSFAGQMIAIGVFVLIPLIWTEVLPKAETRIHFSVNSGLVNHARGLMNPSAIGGLLNSRTEYLPTSPSIEPTPISHNALQAERP